MPRINVWRVVLIALTIPTLLGAAIGVIAMAGDLHFQTLTNHLWITLLAVGERIAYGATAFALVAITYLLTRSQRDRWWTRNGESIATEVLQERYRVARRERNQFEYRLRIRTKELREEQVRNRAACEAIGRVGLAAGQAQLAMSALPSAPVEAHDDAHDVAVLRRVN